MTFDPTEPRTRSVHAQTLQFVAECTSLTQTDPLDALHHAHPVRAVQLSVLPSIGGTGNE